MTRRAIIGLALVAIASATPGAARAQTLAERVERVRDGTVRLSFALKPGVCGYGNTIIHSRDSRTTWGDADSRRSRDLEWDRECDEGPGRLVLDVRDREVTGLRFYVGGRWRPAGDDVTDMGTVRARDAADLLLTLAERGNGRAAREAVFPATLVDSVTIWPALLRLAKNETRPKETRSQAVFWLGQAAGEAATAELSGLVSDDRVDREVRKQAVFALSQRPREEGVPALVRVARTHRDPEIRKQALFWLGQSGDPRALALFEELLTRR